MRKIPDYVLEQMKNRHNKDSVLAESKKSSALKHLSDSEIVNLYGIVLCEHEGYDGEPVATKYVIMDMEKRYKHVGLAPSRN